MPNDSHLESSLDAFVTAMGVRRGALVKLGRSAAAATLPSTELRRKLLADLAATRIGSRSILWIWLASVIAMLVLSVAFGFHHRDRIEIVTGTILGGSGAMVYLLAQLRSVHTKLVSTQILLALLPNLPPEQWAKVSMVLLDEVLKAENKSIGNAQHATNQ